MKSFFWKWLGKNEFIPGVPARDLTSQEVDYRGVQKLVEESPLFKKVFEEKQKEINNGT